MKARTGIFAGTFDPVHEGHLAFAAAALQQESLDEVIFLPEPVPRTKQRSTDYVHRRALLERAITGRAGHRVLELPDRQFTVRETVAALQQRLGDSELHLLLGSDVAMRSLPKWPDADHLVTVARLIVGLRNDDTADDVRTELAHISTLHDISFVQAEHCSMASSNLRRQAIDGTYLSPGVGAYIRQHKLYLL